MKARLAPLAAALALALTSGAGQAAGSQDKLLAELKRLTERMEKLEKRNAELESRLAALPAPALARRVEALEEANRQVSAGLESDRISDKEPELVTRLKALETRADSHGPAARLAETLEGISVEGSVAAVAQRVNGKARADRKDETALTWRGDVGITLPGGDIGASKGEFFTHLRMGQGSGIEGLRPTFTGATNSLAFQQDGVPSENTTAIVAQAWYQLTTPLGEGGEDSPHSLQLTVGKIDPFVFFDQNAAADNEAEKFLNNVFVHNPMLDSGGAVGADATASAPASGWPTATSTANRNGGRPPSGCSAPAMAPPSAKASPSLSSSASWKPACASSAGWRVPTACMAGTTASTRATTVPSAPPPAGA